MTSSRQRWAHRDRHHHQAGVQAASTPEPVVCAFCQQPAQGNFSIHRDGFGVGPEVPLCDACGGSEFPSAGAIWERITQPSSHSCAFKPVHLLRFPQDAPREVTAS